MSALNEANFLEELMPLLQHSSRDLIGDCPSADMLATAAESAQPLRPELQHHIACCSHCGDLYRRLLQFEGSALEIDSFEWQQTEKRLNNWLESLPDAGARRRSDLVAREPGRFRRFTWTWALGLCTAAALVVIAASSILLMKRGAMAPEAMTADRRAAESGQNSPVITTIPAPANKPPSVSKQSSGARPRKVTIGPGASPIEQAQNQTPPITSEDASSAVAPALPQAPPRAQERTVASVQSSMPPAVPAFNGNNVKKTARAASAAALPAAFQIAAGTRVWLIIDGSYADGTFEAKLLQPLLTQGLRLDQTTRVTGYRTLKDGKPWITMSMIIVGPTRYTLEQSGTDSSLSEAGSGYAVQFQSGKVLELWLSLNTTFRKMT